MGKKVQVDDLKLDYDDDDEDDDFFQLANQKRNSQMMHKKRNSLDKWKDQDEVIGDCIEKGVLWR